MTDVVARIKIKGKSFEIYVDVDKALEFKKQGGNISEILATDNIFSDIKKGFRASESDLQDCFQSKDIGVIAEKIIKQGEIQIPQEYRQKEREDRVKQVIDFLSKNATDPRTDKPYAPEVIRNALQTAGVNVENKPVEQQISHIIAKIRQVIPIKIETKKISLKIPAEYSGKVYGLLQNYKEKEEWLDDGTLVCVINLPSGLQLDFYDKLNSMTHGSAIAEEIKKE